MILFLTLYMMSWMPNETTAQENNLYEIPLQRLVKITPVQIVEGILEDGFLVLGEYDLRVMREKLAQTRYFVQSEPFSSREPVTLAGYHRADSFRLHSRYLAGQQKVFLAADFLPEQPQTNLSYLTLILHEALGASGYLDPTYAFSTVLGLIYHQRTRAERARAIQVFDRVFRPFSSPHLDLYLDPGEYHHLEEMNRQLSEGGSTGIGHGGDQDEIEVKLKLITDLEFLFACLPFDLRAKAKDPYRLARSILIATSVRFEPEVIDFEVNDLGVIRLNREYWKAATQSEAAFFQFALKLLPRLIVVLTSEVMSSVYR